MRLAPIRSAPEGSADEAASAIVPELKASETLRRPDLGIPPVTLKQLTYLIAIAEQGSISSAAKALRLSQPSLSENVSRLEKLLRVQLFLRSARGVELTEAGAALAQCGRAILDTLKTGVAEARRLEEGAQGRVTLALPPSIGLIVGVPLAETIGVEAPGMSLHMMEALSGHVMEWVQAGQVDMGCVYDLPPRHDLCVRTLMAEELFLVAASDNIPARLHRGEDGLPTISWSDLAALPLVLPSRFHGGRKVIDRIARSRGIQLNVAFELDSLPQTISMVDRASAFSLLSSAAVAEKVATGALCLMRVSSGLWRTTYLVRRRNESVSRAGLLVEQLIIKILQEAVARASASRPSPRNSARLPCGDCSQPDPRVIAASHLVGA